MDIRIQGGYAGGFGMQGLNPTERPKPIVNPGASKTVQAGKKVSPAQCETCANRMYKDGSDENDVSFQAPGHIDPAASAAVVRGHEQEHVANAYEKAAKGEGKVLQASVSLKCAICPECGTSYVAGGTTSTMIKYPVEDKPGYGANAKSYQGANGAIGGNLDLAV